MEQPKTIFCDIDGTLIEHTGNIIDNYNAIIIAKHMYL